MLAVFILAGCSVPIKDSLWYADEGDLGAAEFHLLQQGQRDISKSEWDKMRFGMACTSLSNVIELKGAIEKLCKQTNNCTYEQIEAVKALVANLEKINEIQK